MNARVHHVRRRSDFSPPTPQPTPCVLWQGPLDGKGYGRKYAPDRSTMSAHRWVMEVALGRRLESHEIVMHLCDNPPCFRFDHLRLGTTADNNWDMVAKGRHNPGRTNGEAINTAKLTEADVRYIRSLESPNRAALARQFGVRWMAIDDVVKRRTWKHVADFGVVFGEAK